MERVKGLGPSTFCMASRCSTTELHPRFERDGPPLTFGVPGVEPGLYASLGADDRDRTGCPQLGKLALYRMSYVRNQGATRKVPSPEPHWSG